MTRDNQITLTIGDLEMLLNGDTVIFGETDIKLNSVEDWNRVASIIHDAYLKAQRAV